MGNIYKLSFFLFFMVDLKVDGHAHSFLSGDPYLKKCMPDKMIDYAFRKGLDVLVVGDWEADHFLDYVWDESRRGLEERGIEVGGDPERGYLALRKGTQHLRLLRGIQWPGAGNLNHVLGIGQERHIDVDFGRNYSLADRIKIIKDQGGIAGAAHPFSSYGGMDLNTLERYADILDFIETFNPLNVMDPRCNRLAAKFAKGQNIPGLANSDAHSPRHVGMAYTVLEDVDFDVTESDPKSREIILKAILENDREFVEKPISKFDLGRIFVLNRIIAGTPILNGTRYAEWDEVGRAFGLVKEALFGGKK
jgi:predicted metal-dependent phosphoesterase TrpH